MVPCHCTFAPTAAGLQWKRQMCQGRSCASDANAAGGAFSPKPWLKNHLHELLGQGTLCHWPFFSFNCSCLIDRPTDSLCIDTMGESYSASSLRRFMLHLYATSHCMRCACKSYILLHIFLCELG